MCTKLPGTNAFSTANNPSVQDPSFNLTVERQIGLEELKYRAALKADKPFEVVKAIRVRIKYLTRLIK